MLMEKTFLGERLFFSQWSKLIVSVYSKVNFKYQGLQWWWYFLKGPLLWTPVSYSIASGSSIAIVTHTTIFGWAAGHERHITRLKQQITSVFLCIDRLFRLECMLCIVFNWKSVCFQDIYFSGIVLLGVPNIFAFGRSLYHRCAQYLCQMLI